MQNTIAVVGSVHRAQKNFKAEDVYNRLNELKPDVILIEYPLEWEWQIMQTLEKSAKDKSVEAQASLRYHRLNPVVFRAYDIEGRNEYYAGTGYFEKEELLSEAYNAYFASQEASPDAMVYRRIIGQVWRLLKVWDKKSFAEINSPRFDTIIGYNLKLRHLALSAIIALVPELSEHKAGWLERHQYEERRNLTMAENIIKISHEYENKTLVVLCGYFHRYKIREELLKRQNTDRFILL